MIKSAQIEVNKAVRAVVNGSKWTDGGYLVEPRLMEWLESSIIHYDELTRATLPLPPDSLVDNLDKPLLSDSEAAPKSLPRRVIGKLITIIRIIKDKARVGRLFFTRS